MKRSLIWVAILVLASAGFASAQETTTGTIFGRVTDEQGGVIPGATVTVTSDQGEKVAVSDGSGRFNVPFLTPGSYSIRVELAGFAPIVQEAISVRLDESPAGLPLRASTRSVEFEVGPHALRSIL